MGYPMMFRYPPIAYLLLWPLGTIPLRWAGFTWMLGAWAVSVASIQIARAAFVIAPMRLTATLLGFACMLAYCVLGIRSGNIQPYLIGMIFTAINISSTRPIVAAGLLALSISFKIWPAFFLPCFFRRHRRTVLIWLVPALLVLWLAPAAVWSPSAYSHLIVQWYRQELQIVSANSELWYFPGQSLRGVLLRYMTPASPWLHGFPDVHFLSLSPVAVVHLWFVAASSAYLVVSTAMLRSAARTQGVWDGVFFALFTLLEPFCPKSSMISLGPAVLIAAMTYSESTNRPRAGSIWLAQRLFVLACSLSFLCAVLQYRPVIRVTLAIGMDFYVSLLLFVALILWSANVKSVRDASGPDRAGTPGRPFAPTRICGGNENPLDPGLKRKSGNVSPPTVRRPFETMAVTRCSECPSQASGFASKWTNQRVGCSEMERDSQTLGGSER